MIDDRLQRTRARRHAVGFVLVGILGATLVGCGSEAGESSSVTEKAAPTTVARTGHIFSDGDFGFNFTYPKDWSEGKPKDDAAKSTGGKPAAGAAVGLDNDNTVFLLRYDLPEAVDPAQLPDHVSELDGIVSQFAGRPMSGTVTDIGGIPAVRYEEIVLVDDPRASRIVFLFDGSTEYEINCQSNADGREKINQGCDQVLSTLRKR